MRRNASEVNQLTGLCAELAAVGERDAGFRLPHERGDEFHHGIQRFDPRSMRPKPRDIDASRLRQRQVKDAGFQVIQ